jgi:hypothetical protein
LRWIYPGLTFCPERNISPATEYNADCVLNELVDRGF